MIQSQVITINYMMLLAIRQGYGDKHITLYDIRAELNHRYKDLRTPYRSPLNEERFNMITKETPETFFVGGLCAVISFTDKLLKTLLKI